MRAVCALPVGNVPDCRTCCPTGTRACCRTSKRGSGHVRLYPLGIFPILLVMISMILAKELDANDGVTKEAIYRTALSPMTRHPARRLPEDGFEKIKRLDNKDLRNFRAVDQDAKRWKYNEKDIHDLQKYMTTNRYCRDSPNEKDTIKERNILGTSNMVCFVVSILSISILSLFTHPHMPRPSHQIWEIS